MPASGIRVSRRSRCAAINHGEVSPSKDAGGSWDVRVNSTQPTASGTEAVNKGFTGHEQEEDLGVINMGGRIYDPRLAHFLQADPNVTAPFMGQSWNRYSYAFQNPLTFVDPTGFDATNSEFMCWTYGECAGEDGFVDIPREPEEHYYDSLKEIDNQLKQFMEECRANPAACGLVEAGDVGGGGKGQNVGGQMMPVALYNSKLSDAEKHLVMTRPTRETAIVLYNAQLAVQTARILFPGHKDGTPGNAFQHALWGALNANSLGARTARVWQTAHEMHGWTTDRQKALSMMDLVNNEVGFRIGEKYSREELVGAVFGAMSSDCGSGPNGCLLLNVESLLPKQQI